MKILNLLSTGETGGIEVLCRDIGLNASYTNVFCFLFGEGIIYEKMKLEKINVISLSNSGRISSEKLIKLKKLAKNFDIIVAHHNDPFLQMYYIIIKKVYPYKKYVMMRHSCFNEGTYFKNYNIFKKILRKWALRKSMNISDALIFVSKAGMNSFLNYFHLDTSKCYVVYNGISNEKRILGLKNEIKNTSSINLLFVGRLYEGKGVHLLIDAFSKLVNRYNIRLIIVGNGVSYTKLKYKVQKLNLDNFITFVGQKEDVIPYLKSATVFVYPSIVQEVFGISLVEAMAFGLVCVANRVGGIPEIIENGVNGFFTDEISVQGLIDTLSKVFEIIGTEKQIFIANNAKKTANDFSIDKTIIKLEEIYKKLMNNS